MPTVHNNPNLPRAGDVVSQRFRIDRVIGEGGFSVVFEATQINLGRRVAIKMLLPEILGDSYNLQLFQREAHFAKNLRHPNIIEIYDHGETAASLPFIVMEHLEGQALSDLIEGGALEPRRVWRVTAQVLKALMASHRHGVIHRDIKPSNVFLCDHPGMPDFVKVIDFGIAKALTGPGEISTSAKGSPVTGTPHYMAPEQISGEGLGPHTDLYALGLVMAEALTGQPVYSRDLSLIELLRGQMSMELPPIPRGVLEGPLGAIVQAATQKRVDLRYRSAAQMLEDIERVEFDRVSLPVVSFTSYKPTLTLRGASEPQPGATLGGRYRLDELLSRRPHTLVYKATQLSLERQVAIKVLRPEAVHSADLVEYFKEEMRIVRQLDSPHTIRIVDYGESSEGLPFMVMEWLNGMQLSLILDNVRLLPQQVVSMARQTLASLREAHRKGIVHHDINPASLFLCDVGQAMDFVKVTDFGRSAAQIGHRDGALQSSETSAVIGAPHYMAPEQLLQGRVGPHTDLYALGLVMAEALTGRPVYDSSQDPVRIAQQQASDAPPPIPEFALRGHLGAVIERATRKELALRYTSVDEMMRDLSMVEDAEREALARPAAQPVATPAPQPVAFKAITRPRLLWRFETHGHVRAAPVIGADGTIYVGSFDGCLYAVYPNGQLRWRYKTQGELRSAAALDRRGIVLVGSRDARVHAVSASGALQWAYETVGPVTSSPVVGRDGALYVGSGDRALYAINEDGTARWYVATQGPISSSPALGQDGTIYAGSEDQRLYAIEPDGRVRWSVSTGGRIYGSPACGPGVVYVGSDDEHLYAVGTDGQVRWKVRLEFFIASTPVVSRGGVVHVASNDGTLHAIDGRGQVRWTYQTGESVTAPPALDAEGNVYLGSNDGKMRAISPTGSLIWSFEVGDWLQGSPVVGADGVVYFGADDGRLYALAQAV